ncbi:MAG TPA: response regulator transcription factor [Gemmatimonadales bacterium]|nr:response regulator transcription factor [Gemmatimonadales bacterium]
MTRVVVAAASPAERAGLAALLAAQPGLTVLETATRAGDLADLAELTEADVVVVALGPRQPLPLPLALAPDAVGRAPAVVVLGDAGGDGWELRALRAGAAAALPRTAGAEQITAAVAAAAAGLVVMPAGETLPRARPAVHAAPPVQPLTPREIEILALVAEGLANKEIAARLGISDHTVKTHLAALFAKLGVSSRAEAVASAARLGLIML